MSFGIIDDIIREPIGGAHTNHEAAAAYVDAVTSPGIVIERAFTRCGGTTKRRDDGRSTGTPRAPSAAAVMSRKGADTTSPASRRRRPSRILGATRRRADANWLDS